MIQSSPGGTVYLLKRAELATRSCVEVALADSGLTSTQFLTLLRLKLDDGLSSAGLARAIGVQPQSVTEIVKPLEARGLIKRGAGLEHHRSLHIRLTAKGRSELSYAMRIARKLERELLAGLSDSALRVMRNSLEKLRAAAEAHDLHPRTRRLRDTPKRIRPKRIRK